MTAICPSPFSHAWGRPRAADTPEPSHRPPTPDKSPKEATNPGAGRTTRQGRLTESPASIRSAGPSGQRGQTKHQKGHTNK